MITASYIADVLAAERPACNPLPKNESISSFAISLDEVRTGSVFFALAEPDYRNNCFNRDMGDTNVYIPLAFKRGAAVCITRPDSYLKYESMLAPFRARILLVKDVIASVQMLARVVFQHNLMPVVAITGSAGKTTTKDIVARILHAAGKRALISKFNRNNGLGMPLTVLELCFGRDYEIAVLEMGMSTPKDEIGRLCKICPPSIAVLLNVLPVHLQFLGSLKGILKAKAQIFDDLAHDGTAILNSDDSLVMSQGARLGRRLLTFGRGSVAQITARGLSQCGFNTHFTLVVPNGTVEIDTPLIGAHNVSNILAAVAVALTLKIELNVIASALRDMPASVQRGEIIRLRSDIYLIDDSYNSNPASLLKAAAAADAAAGTGKKVVLVVGDMLELGPDETQTHCEVGAQLALPNVRLVIGVGILAEHLIRGLRQNASIPSILCEDSDSATVRLLEVLKPNDLVLIKGSRAIRLDKTVTALKRSFLTDRH